MTEKIVEIENRSELVRDLTNRAVINTNSAELAKYKANRAKRLTQDSRINKLETEMGEIKSMLSQILEKL